MNMKLTVIIEESDGVFCGQIAEFPGAISQGATKEELMTNLKEALELLLDYEREKAQRQNSGKVIEDLVV